MSQNNVLDNLKESSSEDMVTIQIEESLVRETLMAIDTSNFKEDIITILSFGFILVFVLLTGICGPNDTIQYSSKVDIPQNQAIFETKFPYSEFSSLNNHIVLWFSLTPINASDSNFYPISFKTQISCENNGEVVKSLSQHYSNYQLQYKSENNRTARIRIFNDTLITYTSLNLNIVLDSANENFSSFTVDFVSGSPEHSIFQIYFRFIFTAIAFLFFVLLLFALRKMEFKYWHLEQKLTIPLLLLLIMYNNPLYIVHCYYPSIIVILFDKFVYGLFHSYLYFFILAIFDSLRYKNRKTDTCFFVPKITLCIIMFILYSAHGIYDELHMLDKDGIIDDKIENILGLLELIIYLVFSVLVTIYITRAGIQVDVTERYKFYIYFSSGILAVIIIAIAHILSSLKIINGTSISFVLKYSVENVLTLLMAYFHWPYEVLQDQQYDDTHSDQQQPTEFLATDP